MEKYALLICVACIVFTVFVGKIFSSPLKKVLKFILNSVMGVGLIWITNLIGANFNFHIGLNWYTIIATGLLGVPGVILMIILKVFV
ncbi:MAG: pro-sigmaK processing inhibitor BofA family protein [Clostridia bacterium]|nr:pro-sigmaK processing inhibitor BofA family protein [Clostridia bacterium]